jgi:hypothetical protein
MPVSKRAPFNRKQVPLWPRLTLPLWTISRRSVPSLDALPLQDKSSSKPPASSGIGGTATGSNSGSKLSETQSNRAQLNAPESKSDALRDARSVELSAGPSAAILRRLPRHEVAASSFDIMPNALGAWVSNPGGVVRRV